MLAIGRALVTNPRILVMDEPSEGLAPTVIESLIETFRLLEEEGLAILLIEQNLGVATALAERQLVMIGGGSPPRRRRRSSPAIRTCSASTSASSRSRTSLSSPLIASKAILLIRLLARVVTSRAPLHARRLRRRRRGAPRPRVRQHA